MHSTTTLPRVFAPERTVEARGWGFVVADRPLGLMDGPLVTVLILKSMLMLLLLTRVGVKQIARLCASMRFALDRSDTSCKSSSKVVTNVIREVIEEMEPLTEDVGQ